MNDTRHDSQSPPPPPQGAQGQHRPGDSSADSFFDKLRDIDMRRQDGWFGGVAGGLGARTGLDPIIFRAGFVLLSVMFGVGVLAYLLAWLFIPDLTNRSHVERAMKDSDGTSITLSVFAGIAVFSALPWWGGGFFFGWNGWIGWWFASLAVIGLLAWGMYVVWQGRDQATPVAGTGRSQAAPPPPAPHTAGTTSEPTSTSTELIPAATGFEPATAGHVRAEYRVQSSDNDQPPNTPPPPPPTPSTPAPATPPKPTRRSGGPLIAMMVTGLTLVTFGGLDWAARTYEWQGSPQVLAALGTLGLLGVVLMGLGLAGRRSGFPGFLATVALITALVVAPLPQGFQVHTSIGDRQWAPITVVDDQQFRLGIGEGRLDLRMLDREELSGQTIRADVNIGSLEVIVPRDLTVEVRARGGIGDVKVDSDTNSRNQSGIGGIGPTDTAIYGEGDIDLTLDLSVGIGQVTVERN